VSQLQRHPLRDYYYYGVSVRVYVCDPLARRRRRRLSRSRSRRSRMRIPLHRRPLGRGHASRRQWHQPATHHPVVVRNDNCVHLDRQLPRFYALSSPRPLHSRAQPPTHPRITVPEEKSPEKKKGFFARLFVSSVILMSCPVYDVLSSRPIKKTKSKKKKKYAIPRLYKYNNNIVIPIYFSFLRPTL